MRYQRIENLSPGGFSTVTHPIIVEVSAPLSIATHPRVKPEQNPFYLSVHLQTDNWELPGTLRLHSANTGQFPTDPEPFLIQDWTYTLNGDSFEGSLTSTLNPVLTSWVTTQETGGVLPTCLANMWQGARLRGAFSGNEVTLSVSGKAGAAHDPELGIIRGGGTCALGAVIEFEANVRAQRAR